jgi:hypothetical protein
MPLYFLVVLPQVVLTATEEWTGAGVPLTVTITAS